MLYIVATPIGNLEDITLRALRVLGEVDFILAEDTRKTANLLARCKIENSLNSFFEHNEAQKIPAIIRELKKGKNIALVSSAGAPSISDPGYKLIRECRCQNLAITSLPGPCSAINALTLSSLPRDKFIFLGYLPRKKGARRRLFSELKQSKLTLVFFESPYRLLKTLSDLKEIFGNPRISICREMTKKFEEVIEEDIEQAISHFKAKPAKGEFTLVVNPSN